MATIQLNNPNSITKQLEDLYTIISVNAKDFLESYGDVCQNLSNNWTGSDAKANQDDLAKVYAEIHGLFTKMDKIIAETYNEAIWPLLNHIQLSGGDSYNQLTISESLRGIASSVSVTSDNTTAYATEAIFDDNDKFIELCKNFDKIKIALVDAAEKLLSNWEDGADRATAYNAFDSFKQNVDGYQTQLENVKKNLGIVVSNKKSVGL